MNIQQLFRLLATAVLLVGFHQDAGKFAVAQEDPGFLSRFLDGETCVSSLEECEAGGGLGRGRNDDAETFVDLFTQIFLPLLENVDGSSNAGNGNLDTGAVQRLLDTMETSLVNMNDQYEEAKAQETYWAKRANRRQSEQMETFAKGILSIVGMVSVSLEAITDRSNRRKLQRFNGNAPARLNDTMNELLDRLSGMIEDFRLMLQGDYGDSVGADGILIILFIIKTIVIFIIVVFKIFIVLFLGAKLYAILGIFWLIAQLSGGGRRIYALDSAEENSGNSILKGTLFANLFRPSSTIDTKEIDAINSEFDALLEDSGMPDAFSCQTNLFMCKARP